MIPTIFSLAVAAVGWNYMFYSRAASRLSPFEDNELNRRRITLRRFGGFVMLLLAIFFFAGFHSFDLSPQQPPTTAFLFVWLMVFLLLGLIVILGMLDLRLTIQLRRSQRR